MAGHCTRRESISKGRLRRYLGLSVPVASFYRLIALRQQKHLVLHIFLVEFITSIMADNQNQLEYIRKVALIGVSLHLP